MDGMQFHCDQAGDVSESVVWETGVLRSFAFSLLQVSFGLKVADASDVVGFSLAARQS